MLAIKLKVAGRRNQRTFRVIVQEARAKLQGKFVEDVGWYNPHTNQFLLKQDRVQYWMSQGAKPTESVEKLLKKSAETGGVETYVAREGRKKKKDLKGEEGTASAPTAASEAAGEKEGAEVAPQESGGAAEPQMEAAAEAPDEAPREEAVEDKKQNE